MSLKIKMPSNKSTLVSDAKQIDDWVSNRNGKDIEKANGTITTNEQLKRTTLVMDENLFNEMKVYCAQNKIKMKDFLNEAINLRLKS